MKDIVKLKLKSFKTTLAIVGLLLLAPSLMGIVLTLAGPARDSEVADETGEKDLTSVKRENGILKRRLSELSPRGIHLVVDTARNVLYLKNGDKTIKEVLVSCGSGSVLEDPAGGRRWIFDTPRGEYRINSKLVKPVWIKPDWAFIEEGMPIPENQSERVESGVLGDYALGFGEGYFIHGTLYTRLLGRNVSHGCIRVGDKDLKEVFNSTTINSRVIIF